MTSKTSLRLVPTRALLFVTLVTGSLSHTHAVAADSQPLQVFILTGQSNMQGHAKVSTFEAMRHNEKAAPLLEEMVDESGQPVVCDDVWISCIGSSDEERTGKLTAGFGPVGRGEKIGPEFTFGITVAKHIDGPVLIIKTAWGGKSLHTDFRPPSAEPFEFSADSIARFEKQGKNIAEIKQQKKEASGHYYRLMIDHVRKVLADIKRVYPDYDAAAGYELAGLVWFQGWNDMVASDVYPQRGQPGGYDNYSRLFELFIRDVRNDLDSPQLPIIIGVMGVGGPTKLYGPDQQRYKATHQNFRDAMAAPATLPEFKDSVKAVLTENYWDMQVVELRKREKPVKQAADAIRKQVKDKAITRQAADNQIQQLYASAFSETELEILQESVSNADFHYMGSAGVMAQIGQAFANAMIKLNTK